LEKDSKPSKIPETGSTPKKGIDYYFNEEGLLVMTEKYLMQRGYCCENGCLHCPYGFRKK